jgi:flagellar assembly protein FliH
MEVSGLNIKISRARIRREESPKELGEILAREAVKKNIAEREKRAFEKGFADGRNRGIREKTEELDTLMKSLSAALEGFLKERDSLVKTLEPHVVDLALHAAEAILCEELLSGSVRLDKLVHPLMERLIDASRVRLCMHHDDLEKWKSLRETFENALGAEVECREDPSIRKGGIRVETDIGTVDARLETRWNLLEKSVRGDTA